MTFTLAWKELREHQGVWITMVCMTVGLGLGLAKVVSLNDAHMALPVAAFTILGLAGTYGIVCGSMMFAGEHEGGTLVFLDIFLGRRGLLWIGKFAVGTLLVITQALCVAILLGFLDQQAPRWTIALIGQSVDKMPMGNGPTDSRIWYLILPVVTLEAFAWGLLGSSLTHRVLTGAAIAAVGFTPVWLLAITAPGPMFFPFRVLLALGLLLISLTTFLYQSREASQGAAPTPEPEPPFDPRDHFLKVWDHYEREDEVVEATLVEDAPASLPDRGRGYHAIDEPDESEDDRLAARLSNEYEEELEQAESPRQVLWWLTTRQARPIFAILAVVGFSLGIVLIPAGVQVLWPLFTLLLGVACGVAAFAPEQRDLSYQFLAAQHFPLQVIWRFKVGFWLAAALLVATLMLIGTLLSAAVLFKRPPGAPVMLLGTFADLMGPTLFFGVWLVYGFCVGQLCVWLCRKSILALLVSFLIASAAIGLWLPSLLCGGMGGWQVWAPPLTMLAASWCLMRAWAGGRIWERKPILALIGFGAGIGVWALVNFGYRAWEVPNVSEPLDRTAFKSALPTLKENAVAGKINLAAEIYEEAQKQEEVVRRKTEEARVAPAHMKRQREQALDRARGEFGELNSRWMTKIEEAAHLPLGVVEVPRGDGQTPLLKYLPTYRKIALELREKARIAKDRSVAFDYLAQILALSRNLRNKALLESYLAGIQIEEMALEGLDQWLDRGKPDSKLLRRVLDEMNRHAEETPRPLDCLQTECFRSGGMVANPTSWTFAGLHAVGRIPEQWVAGSIVLSMETPWEDARKERLWQLVWAGLFRGIETPHWQRPKATVDPVPEKNATRSVLLGWLPATEGAGSGVTRARMIGLLDASWLADERLFCSVPGLRDESTRARWHVDSMRQAIALALYRLEEGHTAKDLESLTPKYLPTGLPLDPYSGQPFRYRVGLENRRSAIWSTGPDMIDHGGHRHGGQFKDNDPHWLNADFDLMTFVPQWP